MKFVVYELCLTLKYPMPHKNFGMLYFTLHLKYFLDGMVMSARCPALPPNPVETLI